MAVARVSRRRCIEGKKRSARCFPAESIRRPQSQGTADRIRNADIRLGADASMPLRPGLWHETPLFIPFR
jgi:hypothetical protein